MTPHSRLKYRTVRHVPAVSTATSRALPYQRCLMSGDLKGVAFEITQAAVRAQIKAMGAEVFEVGLFRPDNLNNRADGPPMLPRTWDVAGLMRSIPWLRLQNMQ